MEMPVLMRKYYQSDPDPVVFCKAYNTEKRLFVA